MNKLNIGNDLYLKGRIGWQGLSKDEYLKSSDYKIINATALMDGYVDWENCGYISKERYEEAKEIQLKENDILISKDGTLGKIGYVKNLKSKCSVASGIFVLRNTKPELIDFDYLYHILKSNIFKNFINRNKSLGSTILHLYQRDLANFEIELPDLATQRKVAKILNDLDSKIDNNNKINEELESMAKTIYSYWFLQFEFPNEKGKPYKSSGGKMVWNEELKREIPEGWYTVNLSASTNMYQPKTFDARLIESNGKYMVYGAGGYMGQYHEFNHKKSEIFISCRGSCGNVYKSMPYSLITGNAMIVHPYEEYLFGYFYLTLKTFGVKNCITGSVQPQITRNSLNDWTYYMPTNKDLILKFNKIYNKIIKIQENIIYENKKINALYDFLLPLLMNGQVSFKK